VNARADARDRVLAEIDGKSTTLVERLTGPFAPSGGASSALAARARLERWRRAIDPGGEGRFEQRLALDGWDVAAVERVLGPVVAKEGRSPPPWILSLEAILDAEAGSSPADSALAGLPFAEALAPFLATARARLEEKAGPRLELLDSGARRELERVFLVELSELLAAPFQTELKVDLSLGRLAGETGPERYASFVGRVASRDGRLAFLGLYATAARLAATIVDRWAEATALFLEHLEADGAALRASFGGIAAPVRAVAVSALSRSYDGGRRTLRVELEGGTTLVYRPAGLGLERAVADFAAWTKARCPELALETPALLDRGDHGWSELVREEPCADEAALARYYRRAGALLFWVHALRGRFFSHERLVARGEHPVLVDASTLLQESSPEASVLTTGLLPTFPRGLGPEGDLGGLTAPRERVGYPERRWDGLATDRVSARIEIARGPRSAHIPTLAGRDEPAVDHREEIAFGFARACRAFVAHRDELLADGGPIARLATETVRAYASDPAVHGYLLARTLKARELREGVDRGISIEGDLGFAARGELETTWPLQVAEREALERLEVPAPRTRAVDPRPELGRLSEQDLERELVLVRRALSPEPRPIPRAANATFGTWALAIGEALRELAVPSTEGTTWLYLPSSPLQHHSLEPVPADVYQGRSGIALFLAALARVTGERSFGELAKASLPRGTPGRKGDENGLMGAASLVYSFARVGSFLDDDALLERARELALEITPDQLAADRHFDVIAGNAGTALALLALLRERRDSALLERAVLAGERLLSGRTLQPSGRRAWSVAGGPALTGFAHGASGIARALLEIAAASGDARFREAAQEALEHEDAHFVATAGNWADLRSKETDGKAAFACSWCHGAPGIALARVSALGALDAPAIPRSVEVGLATTAAAPLSSLDSLCCGNMGRVETLAVAGRRLARPDLERAAADLARSLVDRAAAAGGFAPRDGRPLVPGFFQGIAGLGYELLRLERPELPSVLLLE
jgi:lantibiotic modifying enzyme